MHFSDTLPFGLLAQQALSPTYVPQIEDVGSLSEEPVISGPVQITDLFGATAGHVICSGNVAIVGTGGAGLALVGQSPSYRAGVGRTVSVRQGCVVEILDVSQSSNLLAVYVTTGLRGLDDRLRGAKKQAVYTRAMGQPGTQVRGAATATLNPAVALSLETQRRALKQLEPDWDGYGAEPIPQARVDAFVNELRSTLGGLDVPPPDIIPGADGSLQAEWRRRGVELFYGIDSDDIRHLYLNVVGAEPSTLSGDDASTLVASALGAVFRRADAGTNSTGA